MGWSVLDLSSITDDLIALLNDAVKNGSDAWLAPNGTGTIDYFQIQVSGTMPEADRDDAHGCLLSFYLLHVGQDPYFRNTPMSGAKAQTNKSQPLSLNLYYLLTAYAKKNYNQEQQAMSIALRCFHENAIVQRPAAIPHEPQGAEYTITMEGESADSISRLWQALSTPLRLGVIYKVSVVFVTSAVPAVADQPKPSAVAVAVSPEGMSGGLTRLFGASARDSFYVPADASGGADAVQSVVVPGLVRLGDTLLVTGSGLDDAAYAPGAYLTPSGGAEQDVSAWKSANTATGFRLAVPKDATAPAPGPYTLTVGSGIKRSGAVAVLIGARVDGVVRPPQLMPGGGGIYTITGVGFTPAKTEVIFGGTALAKVGGPPGDGEFAVDGAGQTITFKPPNPIASGVYYPLIRVNGVDTPPSWYVVA